MKLSQLITINAAFLIGFGIAFSLYSPLMMNLFSVPEVSGLDNQGYWLIVSFARMFGAVLFGMGLLLWSLRKLIDTLNWEAQRGIGFALLMAYLLCTVVAITQQASAWQGMTGWVAIGLFVVFVLAYGYFVFVKKEPQPEA